MNIPIELILTSIRFCVDNHKCHTEKSMQQKSHGLLAARTSAHIDLYMYLYYVHIYIYIYITCDHGSLHSDAARTGTGTRPMTATTKVSSKIQMQVNTECISPQLHTTAEHQRNRHKWPEVHDYCVTHFVSLHFRQSVIRTAVWCRVMRSQLRCETAPHLVRGFLVRLVL
jgi:hypothetical protein